MKFVTYERTYNIAYVETQSKFKYTMSHTELLKCMTFKLVKQIYPIGAMEKFTKLNCNLCLGGTFTDTQKST